MLANVSASFLTSGTAPKRWGNAHATIVPYQAFEASDGWIIVAVGNDGQFRKFVQAGGRGELADDVRFSTNPARVLNRDTLVPLLAEMVRTRGKHQWIALLEEEGVPCGPINDLAEVFENEQVRARGLKVETGHPLGGTVHLVRNPVRMSVTPPETVLHPPMLGEHTESVLKTVLGYDDHVIERLRGQSVV